MKKVLLSFIITYAAVIVYAQPSSLDSSFGKNGKTITDFGSDETISGSVLQPDGKIVVAGDYDVYPENTTRLLACAVARYKPNGTPDSAFGKNGLQYNKIGKSFSGLEAVALQKDGKIIGSGYANLGGYYNQLIVLRYKQNGKIDSSFAENGLAYYRSPAGSYISGKAMAVQPDDKIVVAGTVDYYDSSYIIVIRFNKNGTIDNGFGVNGKRITHIGKRCYASAITLANNGKIIVGGYCMPTNNTSFGIAAVYTATGNPDKNFGDNGIVIASFINNTQISSVGISPANKIIAAGSIQLRNGGPFDFILMSYTANGIVDSSFGNNGYTITDLGFSDNIYAMVIQPDGKIIAAGSSYDVSILKNSFALARYYNNGKPDNSFGKNGILFTNFSGKSSEALTVLLQPDKKIIAAGTAFKSGDSSDFALARYTGDVENENKATLVADKKEIKITAKPVIAFE